MLYKSHDFCYVVSTAAHYTVCNCILLCCYIVVFIVLYVIINMLLLNKVSFTHSKHALNGASTLARAGNCVVGVVM